MAAEKVLSLCRFRKEVRHEETHRHGIDVASRDSSFVPLDQLPPVVGCIRLRTPQASDDCLGMRGVTYFRSVSTMGEIVERIKKKWRKYLAWREQNTYIWNLAKTNPPKVSCPTCGGKMEFYIPGSRTGPHFERLIGLCAKWRCPCIQFYWDAEKNYWGATWVRLNFWGFGIKEKGKSE